MSESILNEMDLEPIMVKVMDDEEGMGWSLEFTKRVAVEYRRYLVLCKEHPDTAVVPSTYVDEFWHFHILDTQKYQDDCEQYFGYFLHHFPYFGMRGTKDADNLKTAYAESCSLYRDRFGALPTDLWLASKRCPNCGRRCKGEAKYSLDTRPRLAVSAYS